MTRVLTTPRRLVGARRVTMVSAVLVLVGALATVAAGAAPGGNGTAVGARAEHGPSVHNDLSAPLRDIPMAHLVAPRHHADSPLPTPTGTASSDPVAQTTAPATSAPSTSTSFAGVGASGYAPSDANGAVGPNDYVQVVNTRLEIFAKTGTTLLGPLTTNTLWSGFGGECQNENDGDATVRYDALADRWVFSQFALGPNGNGPFYQCVAVSATADPTGSYYRYSFAFNNFPDYPKLSVWPDGYYQTMNMFNSSGRFIGADSCVYNRAAMLVGLPSSMQCFNPGTAYGAILPANLSDPTLPPADAPDMQIGLGVDATHLASFAFHVDWSNAGAGTTFTESDLAVAALNAACGGGACIPQEGTSQTLDSLADRLMYSYEYRNFGDHEAWVVNYSVANNAVAAPRWLELRRTPPATSGALTVYQDATYAPDANFRWMGSIALDRSGDIGLGYSESSPTMYPAIAYTGRTPSDPLNTMQAETIMQAGGGSQTGGLNRWGDYSLMAVDPSNGCTFWYTNQYEPASGSFNWATQIGSFSFATCQQRTDSDFSTALVPVSGSASGPGSASTTVSAGWTAGATQSVALSASGLPAGVTASFAPSTLSVGPGINGSSTLTFAVAAGTPAGTYPITVTGTGPSTTHASTYTLKVGASAAPDFTIAASPSSQSVAAGAGSSYTATVSALNGFSGVVSLAASGLPAGATASFSPASITASGTSTLNVTTAASTPTGTYALTLTGTSGSLTHSTGVSLTVSALPDFTLSATPSSQTVSPGQGTSYQVSVTGSGGFSGSVVLSVSGLPAGASASFSLTTIAGSGSSTLNVLTSASTPAGTSALTVTGTSGALVHSQTVSLIVASPPDFAVSISPISQSVSRGAKASFVVTVSAINGFTGTVTLSFSASPSGPTGSFSVTSLTSGTSALTVVAPFKNGTYTLRVTGTSGATSHAATATLTVHK